MSIEPNCIICLENVPLNNDSGKNPDNILPIPCECKIYCHQQCFDKIEKNVCFICKKPYDLEKYSGLNRLSFNSNQDNSDRLMSFDEIMNERSERTINNYNSSQNCFCKNLEHFLKIITFACIPPCSLLIGFLLVWINGMVANMIFCVFFHTLVDKCFLKYDNILVFVIGLSSLTFWFIVYKIISSKSFNNCCEKYCKKCT